MELESLFSGTRWDILQMLSQDSLSPMELAAKLSTTPANISQQLRLLELAGLVKSERLPNVEKGKPRMVYSIASNQAYVILTGKQYANKQLMALSTYHQFILKSWFLPNIEHHAQLAALFFELRDHLSTVFTIAVDTSMSSLKIYIDCEKKTQQQLKQLSVTTQFLTTDELVKKQVLILYQKGGKL